MGSWNDFLVPAIPPKKSIPPGKSLTRIKRLLLPEEMLTVQKDGKCSSSYKVLLSELYKAPKIISQREEMIDKEKMMDEGRMIEEKIMADENLENKNGKMTKEEKMTALYRKKMKTKGPADFTLVTSNVYRTCNCKGLKAGCKTQKCTCIYFGQECQEGCSCIQRCHNRSLTRGANKELRIGISPIHGLGCFSMENIIKGEYVAEYTGEIVSRAEANKAKNASKFLFETGDKDYLLDASRFGSELAKMNHRRRKGANCEFRLKRVAGAWRAGVWALEDIGVGDELFVDYGDDYRGHGLVTPYIKKTHLG